jgi:AcrR family transcriptional regulator
MRDLAAAAGVATTTLYNLYQSKDELILEATRELLNDLAGQLQKQNLAGIDLFIASAKIAADIVVDNPAYAKAMATMLFNAKPADASVITILTPMMMLYQEMLNGMRAEGILLSETDVTYLARRLVADRWATILIWKQGYIALHDYKQESIQAQLAILKAFIVKGSQAETTVKKMLSE